MGNGHSQHHSLKPVRDPKVLINCRLADDGEWYTFEDFLRHYQSDAEKRWKQAPMYAEKRKHKGRYVGAEYFWHAFGGPAGKWVNNSKPGWDTAEEEKRLADDGMWYNLADFKEFYPHDWESRWLTGPVNDERRFGTDGMPHDAEWFYKLNATEGGKDWSKNCKTLWDTATEIPKGATDSQIASMTVKNLMKGRRLADDGKWYTKEEFAKFYPHDFTERWENAPSDQARRCDDFGNEHDAQWFFEKNTREGGRDWSKNVKTLWDTAPKISSVKRLGDDGTWYTAEEFRTFYPHDWSERWQYAPSTFEKRMGFDKQPHDAKWFYDFNKSSGGKDWTKCYKPAWDEANTSNGMSPSKVRCPTVFFFLTTLSTLYCSNTYCSNI